MLEKLANEPPREPIKQELESYNHNVRNVLDNLFPNLEAVLKKDEGSGNTDPDWQIQRRICSRYHFDNYFIQDLASNTVSQTVVDDIIINRHSASEFDNLFNNIYERGLFEEFLLRLDELSHWVNSSNVQDITTALIDISDKYETEHTIILSRVHNLIADIIFKLLRNSPFSNKHEYLWQGVVRSSSIYLPVLMTAMIESDLEKNKKPEIEINPSTLNSFKRACAEKIERAFKDNSLVQAKGLRLVLEKWREWGSNDYIRLFIEQHLSGTLIFRLLKDFVITDLRANKNFDIRSFSEIADILKVYNILQRFKPNELDKSQQEIKNLYDGAYFDMNKSGDKSNL
jgi:hypothetical protein